MMHALSPKADNDPILHRSWTRAWQGIGARGADDALFHALISAYNEPHRYYHAMQHLVECLNQFESVQSLCERGAEVEVALWFHDAIYDVHRSDNEALSADWARRAAVEGGVAINVAARIHALVMTTKHTANPVGADEQVLIDIDLSILGAGTARFAEYERQIRTEYAHVPEPLFKQKRRAILQSFLDRPRIYRTPYFHATLEEAARANLQAAIAATAR
jgi:predicted metal-dependent HD superfamily phosphohydrolase